MAKHVGIYLRHRRQQQLKRSLHESATGAGVSKHVLWELEHTIKNPETLTLRTLKKLALAYRLSVQELFHEIAKRHL